MTVPTRPVRLVSPADAPDRPRGASSLTAGQLPRLFTPAAVVVALAVRRRAALAGVFG